MYHFSRSLIILFLKVAFGFRVKGRENVPKTGGFILAPNHTSYLDPPVAGSACPRMVYFLAKEELFTAPLLGTWIRLVGCLPVSRKLGDRHVIRKAVEYLKEGKCVCIFPEGMRVPPGMVKEGEPGVVLMAQMAQVPVVPMAILGTQPWTRKIFGFIPWFSRIEVRIGKPIVFHLKDDPKERKAQFKEAVDEIMNNIRALKAGKSA